MTYMDFDYSFVIRTLGKTGEKYQKLLYSIEQLNLKPREVIVVLPEGYEPPPERLGYERFVYTPKGMIAQRVFCLNEIKTKYALFSDDDWVFESSIVEKLAKPIQEGRADVTFPIFPDLLPKGFAVRFVMASLGTAVPMLFPRKKFTKILSSGCYAYNPYINNSTKGEFVAETAPGLSFLISVSDMKDLRFEDEMWLEKAKYSWGDDQIMYYKLYLQGKRIVGVAGIEFEHLDAGSTSPEREVNAAYARPFFKYVFWHRFIYSLCNNRKKRFYATICYNWYYIRERFYSFLTYNKNMKKSRAQGLKDAKEFIESKDYKSLSPVL